MYKLIQIEDKNIWNSFLEAQEKTANFLQSWKWATFLKTKSKTYTVAITDKRNNILFTTVLSTENIKFTKKAYLHSSHGPIFLESLDNKKKKKVLKYFRKNIIGFLNKKNIAFIILESNLENTENNIKIFKKWKKTNIHLQPSDSLIITINYTEEELLSKMHHKTRYNIRLAKKKGVKIIWDEDGKRFKDWYQIMQSTAKRQKIRLLNKSHYLNLIKNKTLTLVLAEFENKIVAGNLLSLTKPTAVYVHGGSDYNYRKLMAPYLLQWESILKAKENNCTNYDFWGVNVDNKNPQWAGISRFKSAFNPEIKFISYLSSYVYIYKPFYYHFNGLLNKLRQLKKFVLSR